MRWAQDETYRAKYQEPNSNITAVSVGIIRVSDGFWWDFNDSTFKNSGWTTQYQALTEDANGMWYDGTGFAVPDSDAQYGVQFKVTNNYETFYAEGPDIIVNDKYLDDIAYIFQTAAAADASTPTKHSIVDILKRIHWFASGQWELDEAPATDTLKIMKNDGTTTGLNFTVHKTGQVSYRDPVTDYE
jgi:hypothetical protein